MNMHAEQAAISQYLETYFSQFAPELVRKLAQNGILRDFGIVMSN